MPEPAAVATSANPFDEWIRLYRYDCTRFVREVLGQDDRDAHLGMHAQYTIDPEQAQVMDWVSKGERRIAVKSGHGVGKTCMLAWIIVWAICLENPVKVVVTAPTNKQLFDALAAEVKTWMKRLPAPVQLLFEVQTETIMHRGNPDAAFISFRTSRPETPEALAGVHSPGFVLLVGDEASGISPKVTEAASGSMSGHNACTILAGNPVRTSGLFYDAFHKLRDDWKTLTISCVGHRRISPDYARDMAKRYGLDSNAYRVRVLGEFPLAEVDRVMPHDWVMAALEREVTAKMMRPQWGVDCAGAGQNKSTLARRKGNVLQRKIEKWQGLNTMQLVGKIKHAWDECLPSERPDSINVDAIGLGAGVAHRLQELGLPAFAINVSELPALNNGQYRNLKAELWFKGRAWFEGQDCSIAGDEDLAEQLVEQGYDTPESTGRITLEAKDDVKKRIPDLDEAEAFILTFASEAVSMMGGANTSWNKPLNFKIKGIV